MIIDPNKINFDSYLENLSLKEGESIKPAYEFKDEVADFAEHGSTMTGDVLPWAKTHTFTRLGGGKLSIWAGESGSGKSLLLGQVVSNLAIKGKKICIASLEMYPKETLYRMICQAATCKASSGYSMGWMHKFNDRIYLYDQLDSIDSSRVLGMAHYAAHELGCQHIVIDSLTKCGLSRDDYAAQAKFVDRLQWCAKTWGVHIHLVAHMRKTDGHSRGGGKFDIRGAAEITDLADNVYIVKRNRIKEKEQERKDMNMEHDAEKLDQPCAYLSVAKNREYGHETEFGLWHDYDSGQYTGVRNKLFEPIDVMPDEV